MARDKKKSTSGKTADREMSIQPALSKMFSRAGRKMPTVKNDLWTNWPAIVGDKIAERTLPLFLKDGELVIAVESTAWANELSLMREELIEHLRNEIPGIKLTEVKIEIRKLPKGKIKPKTDWTKQKVSDKQKGVIAVSLSKIEDKKLRKRLETFLTKQAKWLNSKSRKI